VFANLASCRLVGTVTYPNSLYSIVVLKGNAGGTSDYNLKKSIAMYKKSMEKQCDIQG
jgi:hypothetical protein